MNILSTAFWIIFMLTHKWGWGNISHQVVAMRSLERRNSNQSIFCWSDCWEESFISAAMCHCSGRLQKERCTSGIMSTFSASSRRTLTRSFQLCLGACTGFPRNTGTRKYLLFRSLCLLNFIEFMFSAPPMQGCCHRFDTVLKTRILLPTFQTH